MPICQIVKKNAQLSGQEAYKWRWGVNSRFKKFQGRVLVYLGVFMADW